MALRTLAAHAWRRIGRAEHSRPPGRTRSAPPRIIHGLWLQGLAQAPPLVRLNFERWAKLNPGYDLRVLDRAGVNDLLGGLGLPLEGMADQALSDIVRTRLLLLHGGVWVDASTFPTAPLDDWLPPLLQASGFFAFERPASDRLISSWFLAAESDSRLVAAWWREVMRYWARPRQLEPGVPADPPGTVSPEGPDATYPYFWLHYLFERCLALDPDLAEHYASGAHRPAAPCRRLREYLARDPKLTDLGALVPTGALVHKLDWRASYPLHLLAKHGGPV